jgi:ribosomal protein S14
MIAKKKAKMVAPSSGDTEEFWDSFGRDPCCVYVLLGACAMTLGCQLPDDYITMLKKVYTEGGLMPDAQLQMKKALFGPDSYKTGEPYDFKSKTLEEEANSRHGGEPNSLGFLPMNVLGPGSFFNTGMTTSSTSIVIKELREQAKGAHVCAVCGAKNGYQGTSLLLCSRCKNRKYCSAGCQKQHWKIHKKACEAVTNN